VQTKLGSAKENTIISIIIIAFVFLIVVFFTSKMWLYDDNPTQQTTFHVPIETLEQTKLMLTDWKYNHKKNFMEVVLEKEFSGEDNIPPSYEFDAVDTELDEEFPVKVMHETDNLFVIHINGVPEDYRFMELKVTEIRDEEVVRAEKEEELINSDNPIIDVDVDDLEDSNYVILLGDYREIEIDNSISLRSEIEYEISSVELEKELVEKEIKVIQDEKIPLEERFILEQENKVKELKRELKFSAGEEKEEIRTLITDREGKIVASFEKLDEYEEEVKVLEDKIKALDEKLEYLESGEQDEKEGDENEKDNKNEQDE